MQEVTVAILSGGMSRRFGSDKTLALLAGKPLVQWLVDGADQFAERIVIAKDLGKYHFLNTTLIKDKYPIQSPVAGMLTAFEHTKNDYVFVISADTPAFPFEAVAQMVEDIGDADALIPLINGKHYMCCALYHKRCANEFHNIMNSGDLRLMQILTKINHKTVDEQYFTPWDKDGTAFINVNTPEELEKLKKIYNKI